MRKNAWVFVQPGRPLIWNYFARILASRCCLAAHTMTNSGTRRTFTMIIIRLQNIFHRESPGAGMFGWTATHAHAKTVEKQLQMMFHIVRVLQGVLSLMRFDWKLETGGGSGGGWPVGMASILELMQRQSKARRIMGVMDYGTSRRPYHK